MDGYWLYGEADWILFFLFCKNLCRDLFMDSPETEPASRPHCSGDDGGSDCCRRLANLSSICLVASIIIALAWNAPTSSLITNPIQSQKENKNEELEEEKYLILCKLRNTNSPVVENSHLLLRIFARFISPAEELVEARLVVAVVAGIMAGERHRRRKTKLQVAILVHGNGKNRH